MDFEQVVDFATQNSISDIHLVGNSPILMRKDGNIQQLGTVITADYIQNLLNSMLNPAQSKILQDKRQVDFMHTSQKGARLRGNAFFTNTGVSVCFRVILSKPLDISELGFPAFVGEELLRARQGLVFVVGPTGQGKSTTLASVLSSRAKNLTQHTLMIEDPVEFIIPNGKGVVQQREIGRDVPSYEAGLMGALREDPDVMMIGELRDKETMAHTLTLAETGHLVFSTLHTNSAVQTITRILDSFTAEQKPQVRSQLANNLSMVISQRLVPQADGNGRVLAFEILTMNYAVANYIRQDKVFQIPNVMQTDSSGRMVQFEQSLVGLVMSKKITKETALEYAIDQNQLKSLFELNNIT